MSQQLINSRSFLVLKHFVVRHALGGDWIVAVSGGVDSMVLLSMAKILHQAGVISLKGALHIDHQTRPHENLIELKMVKKYCEKLGIDFFCESLERQIAVDANENVLRVLRQKIYRQYATKFKVKIALGHHVDDSFEWHLMQQLKTSVVAPRPIPLFTAILVRPLHCFCKKQITHLAEQYNIPFAEDSSQGNLRFERNYVRSKIIPQIVARYPSYLKNFVLRMNGIYSKKKLVRLMRTTSCSILINENYSDDWSSVREVIESEVIRLSSLKRGRIGREIFNLIKNKQTRMIGPHRLSGGVELIFFRGAAFIFQREKINFIHGSKKNLTGAELLAMKISSNNFFILLLETDRRELGISEFSRGISVDKNVVDYSSLRWFLTKKRDFLLRKFSITTISPL